MKEEARRGAGWQKNQQLGNGPEWRGDVAMPKIRAQVRIKYSSRRVLGIHQPQAQHTDDALQELLDS